MLLFGFLLLSTALTAAQDYSYRYLKLCIYEDIVKSLEFLEPAEDRLYLHPCRSRSCPNGLEPRINPSNNCSAIRTKVYKDGNVSLVLNFLNITGFEDGWCRLQNYTINMIYLTGNNIGETTIEMLNYLPPSVREVGLLQNKIEPLRSRVIGNRNLSWLDLSYNEMQSIESGALSEMHSLTHLFLDGNRLEDIEFAASLPSSLKILSVCWNLISEIPAGIFSKLGELKKLVLTHNRITVIQQQALQGLTNLEYLYLSFNPLEIVDKDSFEFTPLLKKVLYDDWQFQNLTDMTNVLSLYNNRTFTVMIDDN